MGCTECGNKGGCNSRKHDMFAAVDESLERLYPDKRWGHRDEAGNFDAGISADEGRDLADQLAKKMGVYTRFVPGGDDEWCDYIYILCLGRSPSVVDIREEGLSRTTGWIAQLEAAGYVSSDPTDIEAADSADMDDRYLRVVLSSVVRFVGVQEVSMRLRRSRDAVVVTERVRPGVFDPLLLPRFQSLVARFGEANVRHLDFGEIVEAPNGFDPGDYPQKYGAPPTVANYLFSPRPVTTEITTVLDLDPSSMAATDGERSDDRAWSH